MANVDGVRSVMVYSFTSELRRCGPNYASGTDHVGAHGRERKHVNGDSTAKDFFPL